MSDAIALVNGNVRTLDGHDTVAEAVLIRRGRIAAVGATADVRQQSRDAEVVDLRGRTVLPGLIDAHAHVELSVLAERAWVDVRRATPEETLRRVSAAASRTPDGDWIIAQGTFGQPMPTRAQLDSVTARHPVVVRQSMHKQQANSFALRQAGVDRCFAPRNGIRVGRDLSNGDATGIVEEGYDLFPAPFPDVDWYARTMPGVVRDMWVSHGVTTIHELPATAAASAAWKRLDAANEMPCRIVLNPILAPGHQATVESVQHYLRLGIRTGFGSERLTYGALKMFLDGSGDAAWHPEQLSGEPREWGVPPFSYNELVSILGACRRAHVQVWMHAVGQVAQWMAINAVEDINRTHAASDHRTRIEHIGNERTDMRQFSRLVAAGVTPVPTAAFMHFSGTGEPAEHAVAFPYRSMLEAGLFPPGNSDSAGTQPFATNPWYGIRCMVGRLNGDGMAIAPADEAVGLRDALTTYTHFGARVGFEESTKGVIAPGMYGDLAVYPVDPFDLPTEDLPTLTTDLTIVAGEVVHGAL
jgi:predicted amidohydrolase YtcJ